jgi:hypothetical protein
MITRARVGRDIAHIVSQRDLALGVEARRAGLLALAQGVAGAFEARTHGIGDGLRLHEIVRDALRLALAGPGSLVALGSEIPIRPRSRRPERLGAVPGSRIACANRARQFRSFALSMRSRRPQSPSALMTMCSCERARPVCPTKAYRCFRAKFSRAKGRGPVVAAPGPRKLDLCSLRHTSGRRGSTPSTSAAHWGTRARDSSVSCTPTPCRGAGAF